MKEALLRNDKESDMEYFTRVAAYIETLREIGNEYEIKKSFKIIGRWLVPIVEEYVECESAVYRLDDDTKVLFSDKVYATLLRIFHKYNNPKYMDVRLRSEQYEIKTFIKSRCKCCIREAVADRLCISQADARKLLKIRQVQEQIARDKEISSDDVDICDIYIILGGSISKQDIIELLHITKGNLSMETMRARGKQIACSVDIETNIFHKGITEEANRVLDAVFSKCSGLDIYVLMHEMGYLNNKTNNMKISEFVKTKTFMELFDEDTTIRSRNNPIRTVNNKRVKMHKLLAGLKGKISVDDIEGGTKDYFFNCLVKKTKHLAGEPRNEIHGSLILLLTNFLKRNKIIAMCFTRKDLVVFR